MIELTPKPNTSLLVVEVPEDAFDFKVNGHNELSFWYNVLYGSMMDVKALPPVYPGNYSFIGTTNSISEEQAAELVEKIRSPLAVFYKNYESNTQVCNMPKDALFSFFRSQGLDPDNKEYAILKKL